MHHTLLRNLNSLTARPARACGVLLLLALAQVACGAAEPDTPIIELPESNTTQGSESADTTDANSDDQTGAEDVPMAHCGDGNVDAGEVCDDGNTSSSDGCSSSCEAETVEIVNLGFDLNSAGPCGVNNDRDCGASYSMTFTLVNFTDVDVERITRIGFRAEGVEISSGGTVCDHPIWLVPAQSDSGLLDVAVSYVPGLFTLYSECRTSRPLFYWETPVETGYFESGSGVLSIHGVLGDGTSFATEAEAALVDLR